MGVLYECVCVLQNPSEVDSCQACSSTLRQGLTKRLNAALGVPASMDESVWEQCLCWCRICSKRVVQRGQNDWKESLWH